MNAMDEPIGGIRIPPSSLEAEQAVLGACLLDPRAIDSARDVIAAADFYRHDHRAVFQAICEIQDAGGTPDMLTVSDRCQSVRGVDLAYLADLAESAPGVSNAGGYARIVREKSERREIIETSRRLSDIGWDTTDDWIDRAQTEAATIGGERTQGNILTAKEALRSWINVMDDRTTKRNVGLSVGYRDLDWRWGGLRPGNLMIIAGRPGSGKTSLAMNIAENVSEEHGVLVFSLEMGSDELMDRSMSRFARVPLRSLRSGELAAEDWPSITVGTNRLSASNLLIDDTPSLHVSELRARARARHRRTPLKLVVIDYLQLLRGDGENQNLRVGHITGQCKALAKEMGCPVILLSQLSRECEKRPDKRPILSDLRDSGSIEQDADYVAFTYRDEMYNENTDRKNIMEVITSKMRMGQPGPNYLHANLAMATLSDFEQGYRPPERQAKVRRHEDPDL